MVLSHKRESLFNFRNLLKVYTLAEQESIINARNEAAAQKIAEIKNNTQAQLDKLVKYKIIFFHIILSLFCHIVLKFLKKIRIYKNLTETLLWIFWIFLFFIKKFITTWKNKPQNLKKKCSRFFIKKHFLRKSQTPKKFWYKGPEELFSPRF